MNKDRLIEQMRLVLGDVLEEFEDRYDGAPDAGYQWMGDLMYKIKDVLERRAT